MRLIAVNSLFLACLVAALAHDQRTFGALTNVISSAIHGAQGVLGGHVHGPNCGHPQPWITSLRPTYYTIPGYDLIIPAEEIDGPQNTIIYNEPLPPLQPIVYEPEVPLQKFIPIPISVPQAPCPKVKKDNETTKTLGVLSNLVHELINHKNKPEVKPPQIQWLPLPSLPPVQPIVHVTPAPFVTTPVVPIFERPLSIPAPPVLPAAPIIGQEVFPIIPIEVFSRGDIPESPKPLPVPIGSGFLYHQVNKDGSVSQYHGTDKSTVEVSRSEVKVPAFAPPAFIDVTPKPIVFLNPPQPNIIPVPAAPILENYGPVEVHQTASRGGYSYNLVNNIGSEAKKSEKYHHTLNHVVKIPEEPCVTPVPFPKPLIPLFNLPAPPAILAPIKSDVKVDIKESSIPVSGSGFSYHQHNVDGSVTSYDGAKAHHKVEIVNHGPTFSLPQPPRVYLPAKSDVQVNFNENTGSVAGGGYSYHLHNGDGSVSSFGGSKGQERIEIFNRKPVIALPEPPRVFLPAKSEVQVNINENSAPVAGSGYSYHLHSGDGSVSSFGGSKAKETIEIVNRGPVIALPQPPVFIPAKSDVHVNIEESSTPVSGSGFSYHQHNVDGTVTSYDGSIKKETVEIKNPISAPGITFGFPASPRPQISIEVPAIVKPFPSVSLPAPPTLPGLIEIPKAQNQGVVSAGNGGYSYKLTNNRLEKIDGNTQVSGIIASAPSFAAQQPNWQVNAASGGYVYKTVQKDGSVTTYNGASPATENISGPSPLKQMVNRIQELCNGKTIRYNGGYSYKYAGNEAGTVTASSIPALTLPNAISSNNVQVTAGKGYSYKLVNNGAINKDWEALPTLTSPSAVHITSRPVLSTHNPASQAASKSGYKFSYSSPSYASSSSGVTVRSNFVSTTSAPIFASFSQEPIVVPEEGGYSYRQTNSDGSTLKVDSDQRNQVTVSLNESGRGDIP